MARYDFFVEKTLFLTSSRPQFFFAGYNCDKNELMYARVSVRKTVSLRRVAPVHPTLPDCLLAIRTTPLLFFDKEGLPIS